MIAFLVAAAVIGVMLVIVMNETGFPAAWANGMRMPPLRPGVIWGELMPTFTAKILLITIGIFAITIKVLKVVAFRALNLI